MNPGPILGTWAVAAAYAVVLTALLVFMLFMASKQKRLKRRRTQLHDISKHR